MDSKRIAIVRTGYPQLSLRSYNVQEIGFAKALCQSGYDVDVFSMFLEENRERIVFEINGKVVRIVPLQKKWGLCAGFAYYPGLLSKLNAGAYGIIHVIGQSELMSALVLKKFGHGKAVCTFLEGMYQNYRGWKRMLQACFDIICKPWIISGARLHFAKTIHCRNYLLKKGYSRVEVLPVGLDFQSLASSEPDEQSCLLKNSPRLLYVGKLETRRNPIFLLRILEVVHRTQPDVRLLVIGDGPLALQFDQEVVRLGLMRFVERISQIDNREIGIKCKQSDVLLLPTHYEIYGMVVMEALFYGLPVVASAEAGPQTILSDEKLGVCLHGWNAEQWAKSVLEYTQSFQSSHVGYRKEYVMSKFHWQAIAYQYLDSIARLARF